MVFKQDVQCPACASFDTLKLPVPHPETAMLSDGQKVLRPLQKQTCLTCGYGFHTRPPTQDDLRDFFDEEYSLGQRDPGAEIRRAEQYAHVIKEFVAEHVTRKPRRIVEAGCGMGSLLSLLVQRWTCEAALGVEPSKQLVDIARGKNADNATISQGFLEDIATVYEENFDLCLSVNVIEHTLSPFDFLDVCRKITKPNGHILIVCPDGETPNLELLFYDHLSSFTRASLDVFARRAGLKIVASQVLQGSLQGFQMLLLQTLDGVPYTLSPPLELAKDRADFFNMWRQSADRLLRAIKGRPYVLFGAGEVADLLATYCPEIIDQAHSIVVDTPFQETYLGKPLISTDMFLKLPEQPLVAAVNERSWQAVKERFEGLNKAVYHAHLSFLEEAGT